MEVFSIKRFLFAVFLGGAALAALARAVPASAVGACPVEKELTFATPADLRLAKLGVQRGTSAEGLARALLGDRAKDRLTAFDRGEDVAEALKLGKVQAAVMDEAAALQFVKASSGDLSILPGLLSAERYAIGFRKGNQALLEKVNRALAELKAEGTLEAIVQKYREDPDSTRPEDIDLNGAAAGGKLTVGMGPDFSPYDMTKEGGFTGIDVEVCAAVARKLGMELSVVACPLDALFSALEEGRVDMICSGIAVTEERKRLVDFSEPYEISRQVGLVRTKSLVARPKKER